jgi:DNA (cytosine-5)-methyltransferase 1
MPAEWGGRTPRPAALDLFAGGGGASLGLMRAGLDVLGVEWDTEAAETHRAITGPCIQADIRDVGAWLPDVLAWLDGRPLALLWASPPCQAWSSAGSRLGAADPRNGWPWLWDAVDALRAAGVEGQAMAAENVTGMLHHPKPDHPDPDRCRGCYLDRRVVPAAAARWAHAGRWTLDAASYGVPQHRRRVIVWGAPRHVAPPAPTHYPTGGMLRPWWVGAREALAGGRYIRQEMTGATSADATGPAPAVTTGGTLYAYDADPGSRPSPTVTATEGKGCATDDRRASRMMGRRLTAAECAILQGWPEARDAPYQVIGNAVPPMLAQRVAGVLL